MSDTFSASWTRDIAGSWYIDVCRYDRLPDRSTSVNVLGEQMPKRATLAVKDQCCASVLEAPLRERDAEELARAFAALADPVRLRLLSLIASADEVCSCELEAPLGRSQPTISHHTKALADAGLITGEKRGRWMYWRVVPDRV